MQFASSNVKELKNVCSAFMQNDSKFGIHYEFIATDTYAYLFNVMAIRASSVTSVISF